jgi:hypothetical protein
MIFSIEVTYGVYYTNFAIIKDGRCNPLGYYDFM